MAQDLCERLGGTLLYWNDRPGFIRLLESSGLHVDNIRYTKNNMTLAQLFMNTHELEWFVRTYNPNLNIQNDLGKTVMSYAFMSLENTQFLLSRGVCDVHLRDINGESPVMLAVRYCCTQVVCLLLDNGASLKDAYTGFEKSTRKPSFEMDTLKGTLDHYKCCEHECKLATIAILVWKKRRLLHHDIVDVISKMVWSTRRMSKWSDKYR
jgi:hypothetical protein